VSASGEQSTLSAHRGSVVIEPLPPPKRTINEIIKERRDAEVAATGVKKRRIILTEKAIGI
jgi:hypothetical protein